MSTDSTKTTEIKEVDYFERPNPIWYALIVPPLVYLSFLAYLPDFIPFDNLGQLGTFSKFLYQNHKIVPILIFWATVFVHLLEAVYVVNLARKSNINQFCRNRWFFQTLLIGFPSTRLMNKYFNKTKRN